MSAVPAVNNGDIVGEGYHHRAESRMPRSMRCGWRRAQSQRRNRLCHAWNPVAIMGERRHVL